jgi:hypothetical protein
MSQPSPEELKAKIAAGAERRAAKIKSSEDTAALRRLENEARLCDIEDETGKTLGVDLAVAYGRFGDMVVVTRPRALKYEKFQFMCTNGAIGPKDVDALLADGTVVYPPKGEQEALWEREPALKTTACELAQRLYEVSRETGK